MNLFKSHAYSSIGLFSYFFIAPLVLILLSPLSPFIAFVTFIILGINVGIFITNYLNTFLTTPNIICYGIYSFFFGSTAFTLSALSVGYLGLRMDGNTLIILLIIFSLFSFLSQLKGQKEKLPPLKMDIVDLISYGGFVFFAVYSVFIILNYYFLEYDNFSFWVTDAKIIYLTQFFRTTPEIINSVNYTSFYPLHEVYLFNLMGDLKEQYAAFVSIIFPTFITLFIYSQNQIRNYGTKLLLTASLFLVNCSFVYNQTTLFTSYADTMSASLFAFITILILKPVDRSNLFKKISVVLLLIYAFAQIKYFFFYYAIFLSISLIYVEWENLRAIFNERNFKQHLTTFGLLFLGLAILESIKYYYFHVIWPFYELKSIDYLVQPLSTLNAYSSLGFLGDYVSTAINIFFNKFNWLLLFFLLGLIYPFTVKDFKFTKATVTLTILNILIPLSVFLMYTKNQRDLTNMSIIRYISLSLFLIPLLASAYPIRIYALKNKGLLSAIIGTLIVISTFFFLSTRNPIDGTFHTGRYKDSSEMSGYSQMADYVLDVIPQNENVVVVNNFSGYGNNELPDAPKDYITNIDFDSRFLKYFLFDRNQIGAYMLNFEQFDEALRDSNVKNLAVILNKDYDPRYLEYFGLPIDMQVEGLTLYVFKVIQDGDNIKFESYEVKE